MCDIVEPPQNVMDTSPVNDLDRQTDINTGYQPMDDFILVPPPSFTDTTPANDLDMQTTTTDMDIDDIPVTGMSFPDYSAVETFMSRAAARG